MMVIYDNKGTIYYCGTGMGTPDGLPYMNVNIPDGKVLKQIDTTNQPHQPVFEDIPRPQIDIDLEEIRKINEQQQSDIDFLILLNENMI